MRSSKPGKSISASVENITTHGIWLVVLGREHFLDYRTFPYFRGQPKKAVKNVRLLHQHHLHWPALDVDLEIDNLENPQKYPLIWLEVKSGIRNAANVAENLNEYKTIYKPNTVRFGRAGSLAMAVKRLRRKRVLRRKREATRGRSCIKPSTPPCSGRKWRGPNA